MSDVADERALKYTVRPQVFNTYRHARLDTGITDDQLIESFRAFAVAVRIGLVSVPHGDLWPFYVSTWPRWVNNAPAPTQAPLSERQQSPRRQR